MIFCEKVSKRFGEKFALRNVSFSFKKNLAVLGYNGAGKSTLAKILAGIIKSDSGKVNVFGKDPSKSIEVRRKIGIVTHNPMVYKELTVEENLRFFAKLYGIREWNWILEKLSLKGKLELRVLELSRGYLQRLAIARAFMIKPSLLILDEAFTSLDIESREVLWDLIHSFDGSLFLSTHNFEDVKFCEKFLVLKNGQVVYSGDCYDNAVNALDLGTREERSQN
ncbi:MAG: ABC transporter ATP-binding protein [Archaeoglobaceae archaeon]|nr:ABC transporter ATP-binding protein [Archaeoglobaceae archaeon]MDW7989299.1 ABC transporter ATP-binding protein [Archaeoglobaceae archaeon]